MRYYSLVSNSIFLMLLYLHKFSILQFDTLSDAYDKNVYFVKRYLSLNQRTNGPVNAHLRPEIYTNKLV